MVLNQLHRSEESLRAHLAILRKLVSKQSIPLQNSRGLGMLVLAFKYLFPATRQSSIILLKSSVDSSSKSIIKSKTCSKSFNRAALSDDLGTYAKFRTEQNLFSMDLTFVLNKIEICSEQNVNLFGTFLTLIPPIKIILYALQKLYLNMNQTCSSTYLITNKD